MHDFIRNYTYPDQFESDCDNQLARDLAPFYMPLDPYLSAHSAGAYGADFVDGSKPVSKNRAQRLIDKDLYKVSFTRDCHGNSIPDVGHSGHLADIASSSSQLDSSQGYHGYDARREYDSETYSSSQTNAGVQQATPLCNLTSVQKDRIAHNRQDASSRKKEKAQMRALSLIRGCAIQHICAERPSDSQGSTEPTVPLF